MSQPATAVPDRGTGQQPRDTRARIQAVAVELFTEQGYEKTSLREIAERLDVTKAALYYHFKSKEDIIQSLLDDYFAQVDALAEWARRQPATPARRAGILRRYLDMVIDSQQVYRMMQQNQAALASLTSGKYHGEMFRKRTNALVDLLAEPGATLPDRVRAAMAATGVSIAWMIFRDQVDDPGELRQAVLGVAFELAGATGDPAGGTDEPAQGGQPRRSAAARTSGSTR